MGSKMISEIFDNLPWIVRLNTMPLLPSIWTHRFGFLMLRRVSCSRGGFDRRLLTGSLCISSRFRRHQSSRFAVKKYRAGHALRVEHAVPYSSCQVSLPQVAVGPQDWLQGSKTGNCGRRPHNSRRGEVPHCALASGENMRFHSLHLTGFVGVHTSRRLLPPLCVVGKR
jgi:hypothetical protein